MSASLSRRKRFAQVILALAFLGVLLGGLLAVSVGQERPEDHDEGWFWLHGREAFSSPARCDGCHDKRFCSTCHLVDWPHPEGFLREHGTQAIEWQGRGCSLCHRATYCDPCHGGVRMPHSTDFKTQHARTTQDDAACLSCHVRSDCTACHESHSMHRSGGRTFP